MLVLPESRVCSPVHAARASACIHVLIIAHDNCTVEFTIIIHSSLSPLCHIQAGAGPGFSLFSRVSSQTSVPIHPHARCPPACLPACLPVRLPAFLPAHLPACPPACLPACLPARLPACPALLALQIIGVGASVVGDMSSRPNWGLNELDFVFSTLVVSWLGGGQRRPPHLALPLMHLDKMSLHKWLQLPISADDQYRFSLLT